VEFTRRFEEALGAVEAFRPELVLVSCGFDAHRDDPLGPLRLESSTYGELTTAVRGACRRLGAPEPVLVLEGGYDLDALRTSAASVGEALLAE
jgi:acetoin utilization deacetylase AcuC-like enzyme